MSITITVTPAAEQYIQKRLAIESGIAFRLSVKKTGCSGFSYIPAVINAVNTNDIEFTVASGFKIYLDPKWIAYLENVAIDYTGDAKVGIEQKKLLITNPKEKSRCGCGESFLID